MSFGQFIKYAIILRLAKWASDGLNLIAPGGTILGGLDVMAYPLTSDGIDAAIAKVVASGKPGRVRYFAAPYAVSRNHPLISGVSHIAVPPTLQFTGNVPDADFSVAGGTVFNLSAGVTGFPFNNVDKANNEANSATFGLTNVTIYGITFVGGLRAIDIGAMRAMGTLWCRFDELYAFDQTGDYQFDFKNFQHCTFRNIYTSTQLTSGGGIRLGNMLDSNVLLPGNSTIEGEIYSYCKNRKNRSVVIECAGPTNGGSAPNLNQIKVSGRLQGNRYQASGTPDPISITTTNLSSTLSVTNAGQFDLCQIGMPVGWDVAPAGFTAGIAYFVLSRDTQAQTITLGESPYDTVPVTPTSSNTYTGRISGYPAIEIKSAAGCVIKNSDFGQLDAEAYGNVCAIYIAKTRGCQAHIAEIMTSYSYSVANVPPANSLGTALVCRDAEIGLTYNGASNFTQDISGNWGFNNCRNLTGGAFLLSSTANFRLDASWNGRKVYWTGNSTTMTVTAPINLPKGFGLEWVNNDPAAIVTFAIDGGGAIRSRNGLRSLAGQGTKVVLTNISNKIYSLSGDTQV
jgi:hypothetical protein